VDLNRVEELFHLSESPDGGLRIGAMTRQRTVERSDLVAQRAPLLHATMPHIAHVQIRNRGTIGGSLAHADPAADWLSCLTALGAEVLIAGPSSNRRLAVSALVRGAMETELAPDELITGVRIPRFSPRARFGFHKVCRKAGEFADAIGVVVRDPDTAFLGVVAGATDGRPLVMEMRAPAGPRAAMTIEEARTLLKLAHFPGDAYELTLHAVALKRAHDQACLA
jgi:carbon-monoxide dehydrogenase medium subunit